MCKNILLLVCLLPMSVSFAATNTLHLKSTATGAKGSTGSEDIIINETNSKARLEVKRLSPNEIEVIEVPKVIKHKKAKAKHHTVKHHTAKHHTAKHHRVHHHLRLAHRHYASHVKHSSAKSKSGWFIAATMGYQIPFKQSSLEMIVPNGDTDQKISKQNTGFTWQIGGGYLFSGLHFWPYAFDLGLQYSNSNASRVSGEIMSYGLYSGDYTYQVARSSLLLNTRVELAHLDHFAPYTELGIGLSQNRAYQYSENDPGSEAHTFADRTIQQFAYSLGLGVSYTLGKHWQADLEYKYLDAGKVKTGKEKTGGYDGPTNKLVNNQFNLGILYQF